MASPDHTPPPHGHVVHFHNDDDAFLEVVGSYLTAAALAEEAVVIIAKASSRAGFATCLASSGVDVSAGIDSGTLVLIDADDTLAEFMVDGSPDVERFEQVVGGAIRVAGIFGRPVRAYGEMVAVLWEQGNLPGAVELEGLWNELGERLTFTLLCGYPLRIATDPATDDAYATLCHLHSAVVGGAPIAADGEVARRLQATPYAVRQARRFVETTLTEWARSDLREDCLLVVSELVTNAVMHAGSDATLSMRRTSDSVTLTVGDASTMVPIPRPHDVPTPGGRGLELVNVVARSWGHSPAEVGKFVWAEIASR